MKFWSSDEKIMPTRTAVSCARWAAWLLCVASASSLQGIQAPTNPPAPLGLRPAAVAAHTVDTRSVAAGKRASAAATKKATPPPPPDTAAHAATVSLKEGKLTIGANNSDLNQILCDVAAASGMTIDGLGKTDRVFGTYGPGKPRDVLTDLLTDSGYNFMMAGQTAEGAPRELLLIAQTGSVPPTPAAVQTPSAPRDSNLDTPEELGPGAIAHVAPGERQDSEQNTEERVQNELQRLGQMHSALDQQSDPQ
jgi:hypothetical protein